MVVNKGAPTASISRGSLVSIGLGCFFVGLFLVSSLYAFFISPLVQAHIQRHTLPQCKECKEISFGPLGRLEYAVLPGNGPSVLVLHGTVPHGFFINYALNFTSPFSINQFSQPKLKCDRSCYASAHRHTWRS